MTKIEWTHRKGTKGETWNPIRARNKATGGVGHFCTKVSAGCQNCYAAVFGNDHVPAAYLYRSDQKAGTHAGIYLT